jgi:predicted ATP-grasp superfamily ATP-dependent carboligase
MTRIFVYEWCCANAARGNDPRAATLFGEGWAMLAAALDDFCRVPDAKVRTVLSPALRDEPAIVVVLPGLVERGVRIDWSHHDAEAFYAAAATADYALVIAPEFEQILETRCRWALAARAKLLGPAPDAVALTADKLALAQHFDKRGVRTPPTFTCDQSLADVGQPWVVKPRHGAGSQQTKIIIVSDGPSGVLGDLVLAALGPVEMVVQPLVPGLSASVAFVIGERQAHALVPAEQFVTVTGNLSYSGGRAPLLLDAMSERAIRIARQAIDCVPGLNGYVGVDVVLGGRADGSADYVIEINPRLTTSYLGLRALCEDNLMELLLRLVRAESVARPRWRSGGISWTPDGQTMPFPRATDIATP